MGILGVSHSTNNKESNWIRKEKISVNKPVTLEQEIFSNIKLNTKIIKAKNEKISALIIKGRELIAIPRIIRNEKCTTMTINNIKTVFDSQFLFLLAKV